MAQFYYIVFTISIMFFLLGNLLWKISSRDLASKYAEDHQLRTTDGEHPNPLETQGPDFNSKKF